MTNITTNTKRIKDLSTELGFDYCGIAKAVFLEDDARRLEHWLSRDYHAGMQYMANHFDLRVDPTKLVPGAQSVITLLVNYYPRDNQQAGQPKIARYAFGKDYHEVIREKLNRLLSKIREEIGEVNGRGFVDSAPVLERSWGVKSGLGWIGKNGNLIHKKAGSFYFIATLITDLELTPDDAYAKDFCGNCRKCIDACPTDAILPNKTINGGQCISYFTIELKESLIPGSSREKFGDWIFGCDICQEVCPWNRFSTPHQHPEFKPLREVLEFGRKDWEELTEEQFNSIFKHSPLKRAKWAGLKRNLGLEG